MATDDVLPEETPPRIVAPSPSWLTVALFFLNVVAAVGFGYLLLLDYQARQAWSYGVFRYDLALWGLPLAEEESGRTAWDATKPRMRLDPDQVRKEFEKRTGGRVSEKFQAVHEVIGQRIKPSQLTEADLDALFAGVSGPKVRTLEEEVERVQARLPGDLEAAAVEFAQSVKDDKARRTKLSDLLLPMVAGPWQIDALSTRIALAKAGELDALLRDAGQRRTLVELLRLLDDRRPVAPHKEDEEEQKQVAARRAVLTAGADPAAVKLEQLQELLRERFQEAKSGGPGNLGKESFEKRQNMAYLLYAVSQARRPDKQLLYPKGSERVEAVIGLYEYVAAAEQFADALHRASTRVQEAVAGDRAGYALSDQTKTVPGFVGRYQAQVKRIVDLVGEIKDQEARLARLQGQQEQQKKQYEVRKEHYDDVVARLLRSRKETATEAAELHRLEQQLFLAQRDLADAARTNEQLERDIRQAERAARRGGKP